jgi:uncharacterized cupin superfamily protein
VPEKDPNLKNIDKALKEFPKVVKQKEDAYRENEKVMKPFMKLAKELLMCENGIKARPDFIKHYSEIQEPDNSCYPDSDERLSIGSPFGKIFGFKRLGIHHELLKSGRRTSWPHAESSEEEFVYVVEGEPDAWIDGDLHRLKPGDGVGFVPGTGIAHTFINNTETDVKLLVVGDTNRDDNKCIYPIHPERNMEIGEFLWKSAPKRKIGDHDGLPDKLRSIKTKR